MRKLMSEYLYEDVFLKAQPFPKELLESPITKLNRYKEQPTGEGLEFKNLMARVQLRLQNGHVDLESNRMATNAYLNQEVYPNLIWFDSLIEKINWMCHNKYWDPNVFKPYTYKEIVALFNRAYSMNYTYKSYFGALLFHKTYTVKSSVPGLFLERFEDRAVMTALRCSVNFDHALKSITSIVSGTYQPATPTFSNSGKVNSGDLVSCFLLSLDDTMNNITTRISEIMQLSKRGGGIAIDLSNLRETGAPIRNIPDCGNGLIGLAKILDNALLYSNQADTRRGSGAVYVNIFHPDVCSLLDSKRETIDDGVRLKNLSVGLVVPNVFYTLLKEDKSIHAISPYDVFKHYGLKSTEYSMTDYYDKFLADDRIKKYNMGSARELFAHIASIQGQSGYPYIMNVDIVNDRNNVFGRVSMSNLCTEILQVSTLSVNNSDNSYSKVGIDISCNLGSINVYNAIVNDTPFSETVDTAVKSLTVVSDTTSLDCAKSIDNGNKLNHAIGLGIMNLHGAFMAFDMAYGDSDSIEFTDLFMMSLRYHALRSSCNIAKERGKKFYQFDKSKYATGEALSEYLDGTFKLTPSSDKVKKLFAKYNFILPTLEDFVQLTSDIMVYGLYHSYLLAVAPTGNIGYLNYSTPSGTPVVGLVEERDEGPRIGRVQYLSPFLSDENKNNYLDAYQIGPYKLIDIYAEINKHVDQGASLTLFVNRNKGDEKTTTRDFNKITLYAFSKKIKTLYYVRNNSPKYDGADENNNDDRLVQQVMENWGDLNTDQHECTNCSI